MEGGKAKSKSGCLTALITSLLLCTLIIHSMFFTREGFTRNESVILASQQKLKVKYHHSNKKFHGHPHVISWGGGDDKTLISFAYQGVKYRHKTQFIPIVINEDKDQIFLVYFDRESNYSAVRFRYYRTDKSKSVIEIKASEFPKHIALQNMWLDTETIALLERMDTEDYWFRKSLTCKMWLEITKGIPYSSKSDPNKEFVEQYIKKHQLFNPFYKKDSKESPSKNQVKAGGASPEFRKL